MIRVRPLLISLLATALLAGCAAPRTGVRVGDSTLDQFEAGVTTEAWLLAIIGEPTSWSDVGGMEGTKVYRYELVERKGGVISFFTGDEISASVVYFIITDGVVTRYWTDREVERTLLGKPVEEVGGVKASP